MVDFLAGFVSLLMTGFWGDEFLVSGIGVTNEEMVKGLAEVTTGVEENDEGEF